MTNKYREFLELKRKQVWQEWGFGRKCSCCSEENQIHLAFSFNSGEKKGKRLKLVDYSAYISKPFPIILLCHNCHYNYHLPSGKCEHSLKVPARNLLQW